VALIVAAQVTCGGTVASSPPAVPLIAAAAGPACFPIPLPFQKPALDSVLDSAAVVTALAASTSSSADSATVALHFAPAGTLIRLVPLSGAVDGALFRNYARMRPSRGLWGVRLTMRRGSLTPLSFTPSLYCPPQPQEQPGRVTHRDEVMTAQEARSLFAAGPFRLNILVSEAGLPAHVVLTQRSGNDRQDAMILEGARARRFVPGRLDGIPVPAWYEVTPLQ